MASKDLTPKQEKAARKPRGKKGEAKEKKRPVGRPRVFATVAEMEAAIDAYFAECDEGRPVDIVTRKGDVVTVSQPIPYTMSGLALSLGISRQALCDYSRRSDTFGVEFLDTITRARAKVEYNLEERLYSGVGSPHGHEFGLRNNFGWKDKRTHEHSGPDGGPMQHEMADLSDEQLLERIERRRKAMAELDDGDSD